MKIPTKLNKAIRARGKPDSLKELARKQAMDKVVKLIKGRYL